MAVAVVTTDLQQSSSRLSFTSDKVRVQIYRRPRDAFTQQITEDARMEDTSSEDRDTSDELTRVRI